jgi:hypothetical protein
MTATCALTDDRVDWHLWNWQRWQQHSRSPGQFSGRASGGIIGRSSVDSDEMLNELERNCATATEACLWDMSPRHRLSVHIVYEINTVYRLRDLEAAYAEARGFLAMGLWRRGVP